MKVFVTIVIFEIIFLSFLYTTYKDGEREILISRKNLDKSMNRVINNSDKLLNSLHRLEISEKELSATLNRFKKLSKIDTLKY